MKQSNYSTAATALTNAITLTFTSNIAMRLLIDNDNTPYTNTQSLISNATRLSFTSYYGDEYCFLGGALAAFAAYNFDWLIIANNPRDEEDKKQKRSLRGCLSAAFTVALIHGSRRILSNAAPVSISNTLAFNVANVVITNIACHVASIILLDLISPTKNEQTK